MKFPKNFMQFGPIFVRSDIIDKFIISNIRIGFSDNIAGNTYALNFEPYSYKCSAIINALNYFDENYNIIKLKAEPDINNLKNTPFHKLIFGPISFSWNNGNILFHLGNVNTNIIFEHISEKYDFWYKLSSYEQYNIDLTQSKWILRQVEELYNSYLYQEKQQQEISDQEYNSYTQPVIILFLTLLAIFILSIL